MKRPKIKELKDTYANNGFCLLRFAGRLWVVLPIKDNNKTISRLKRDGYICIPLYTQGVYTIQKGE